MTPSSHPPHYHTLHKHTHSLAAIDSQLSILSTLYPMQPPSNPIILDAPPPSLYTLVEIHVGKTTWLHLADSL